MSVERTDVKTSLEAVAAFVEHLETEIDQLATVLLDEFGGPVCSESACEMAVRVLREQKLKLEHLSAPLTVHPKIESRCPQCGERNLYIGNGGVIRCTSALCRDSEPLEGVSALVASEADRVRAVTEQLQVAETRIAQARSLARVLMSW